MAEENTNTEGNETSILDQLGPNSNQPSEQNREEVASEEQGQGQQTKPTEEPKTEEVDYGKYITEKFGHSEDELKQFIEKGKEYSQDGVRVVKDENKLAVIDLLDKGLSYNEIDLIQKSKGDDLSPIDKVAIAMKLEGTSKSLDELKKVIEKDFGLFKNEDGKYDELDEDVRIGMIKLDLEAEKADKSIKEYNQKLQEKQTPEQKQQAISAEKVTEWKGKIPEVVSSINGFSFGSDEFQFEVPKEDQKDIAEMAGHIVNNWVSNGVEGSVEQLKYALEADYLYKNKDKIYSSIAESVRSKKEEQYHQELHNPNGLQRQEEISTDKKVGLDSLM